MMKEKLFAVRSLIKYFRPEVFYYFRAKLPFSQKLRNFSGSPFSQCFFTRISIFEYNYQWCPAPLMQVIFIGCSDQS